MNKNTNCNSQSIVDLLSNLTPLEFTFLGTIVGYVLAFNLTPNQQNAIGNWFELVGQTLLTFSAQGTVSLTTSEYNQLLHDVELLKQQINKKENPYFKNH